MPPRDTAVFFLTHFWSESIAHRFARLRRQVAPDAECMVLLQDDGGPAVERWKQSLEAIGAAACLRTFDADALPAQLGFAYYGDGRVMGNTHFPLVWAARSGQWKHCWLVESDVEYRGDWLALLRLFAAAPADLLASHMHRFEDWPTWRWWSSLQPPPGVRLAQRGMVKAFLPIFRISRAGLAAVQEAQTKGWHGHFEALLPTVIARAGLALGDLRSVSRCYVGASQNPTPILTVQSSLRWRPEIAEAEFTGRGSGPLLFHPVKQNWAFDGEKVVRWDEPGT